MSLRISCNSNRRRSARAGLLLLLLLAGVGGLAQAQDCRVTTSPLAFGSYDPIETAAPVDASTQFLVDCRSPSIVAFEAALSTGNSGTYLGRELRLGSSRLPYNLYRDAARTIVFGDGTAGTESADCITGITFNGCTGSNPPGPDRRATVPVYGRIPPGADPAAGPHSDTIIVTVTF